jgi:RIO kinase 1
MDYYEDLNELDGLLRIKNVPVEKRYRPWKIHPKGKMKHPKSDIPASLEYQRDDIGAYNFSYNASRHEREWIVDSLGLFYEMKWFSDVLRIVKGGKEASVYQCLTSPDSPAEGKYLAAKVYRPRRFRNLKKDFIYREGRDELNESGKIILDGGKLHAMEKRTEYGRQLMHTSWIEHEFKTMQKLHAAGGDVPFPYASGNNAILMDFIGDADIAAPTLNTIDLDHSEARILFERVIHNIEILLASERVHADLSAFNILYWQGDITLIDFPQAISPFENRSAYPIFERDIRRVCDYFSRQGVEVDHRSLAQKLWHAFKYRSSPEIHPILLDEESEQDRVYWDQIKVQK